MNILLENAIQSIPEKFEVGNFVFNVVVWLHTNNAQVNTKKSK